MMLRDVATFINGYAFTPADYSPNGLEIIRIQNLTGTSRLSNRYAGALDSKYLIRNGDVLISWSASLGVFIWEGEDAWLNQHIFKVVFNKAEIDKDFFVYQMRYLLNKYASLAHGATMKHLTKSTFESLQFKYPSLSQQQMVANHLKKVDLLCASFRKAQSALDTLVKSRFIEMFGDPNHSSKLYQFEEAFVIRDDLRMPLSKMDRTKMHSGTLYPYYGANGVVDYINDYRVDCEALCLAEDCGSYGLGEKCSYLIAGKSWVNNHAHVLLPTKRCNLTYADTLFTLLDISKYISGTTRSKLTQKQMRNILIPLPDIDAQLRYEAFVNQIDKLRFDVQKQIDKLETLKASLMQQYFD